MTDSAGDDGATARSGLNLKRSANQPGPVCHGMHSDPRASEIGLGESASIIDDLQYQPAINDQGQLDDNCFGFAVLDRVADGLLGDAVEVRGHDIVMDEYKVIAIKNAGDLKGILQFSAQFPQCAGQSPRFESNRLESTGELAGLGDRIIHQFADFFRGGRFGCATAK
jgi:hypothetical protein